MPLSSGDFLKNSDGDIVIVKMNATALQRLADRGGGAYTTVSADDLDVNTLNYVMESSIDRGQSQASDRSADLWRELGPSLLLLALPLAALAFRRGLLWLAPIFLLAVPPDADAFDWQALWQNDDQRALQLYREGQHGQAAELFDDRDWQATASYRAGDYESAAENWQRLDGVGRRLQSRHHPGAAGALRRSHGSLRPVAPAATRARGRKFQSAGDRGMAKPTTAAARLAATGRSATGPAIRG